MKEPKGLLWKVVVRKLNKMLIEVHQKEVTESYYPINQYYFNDDNDGSKVNDNRNVQFVQQRYESVSCQISV